MRAHVSTISQLPDVRLVASKSHRGSSIDQVKSALGISNELNIGSVGLKLGTIALGERDLYVNPSSKTSSWDTCAPEALLVEAGGRVSDIQGVPLRYDSEVIGHTRGLLASNGRVHDAAVAKLAPLFAGKLSVLRANLSQTPTTSSWRRSSQTSSSSSWPNGSSATASARSRSRPASFSR